MAVLERPGEGDPGTNVILSSLSVVMVVRVLWSAGSG